MRKQRTKHSVLSNNYFALRWYFKVAPGYFIYKTIETIFNQAIHLFEHTFLLAYIIDCIENKRSFSDVLTYLIPLVIILALKLIITHLVDYYITPRVVEDVKQEVNMKLCGKAVSMEISRYDDSEFYNDFVWAMQKAPDHIFKASYSFFSLISNITAVILAGAFVIATDLVAVWVVAVMLVLILITQTLRNKRVIRREEEALPHTRKRDYTNRVFYLIDFVKDLKMSNMAGKLQKDFYDSTEEIKKVNLKHALPLIFLSSGYPLVQDLLYDGGYLSYLFYKALVKKTYGMGTLLALYNSANRLKNSINTIINLVPKFQEHSLYIEKLRTFLETENEMLDNGKELLRRGGNISINNLTFTYKGNSEPTLRDISMNITKGEKIALVGFNGAGKSTLIKLLLRLYDPNEGYINYNGKDIRDYPLADYRKQFGTLFQDFEIFASDIATNITMDENEFDKERADIAVTKAAFMDKLSRLPNGYNTQLTKEFDDSGVSLSGGEAQKLALARVLYADSDFIILDEPSSALDPIAEYELNKTVTELAHDKTVIIISHRLSTTRFVDKIYMLESGRIIEQGSHDALLNQGGKYAEMFTLQAEKYR